MKWLAFLALPTALVGSLFGLVVLTGNPSVAGPNSFCLPDAAGEASLRTFDEEQLANAATIIEVGRARNVPPHGWVVALAAAMQESSLRNLPYGDRDSAGLFQMRPSMGWGSLAQVTDTTYAATAFYGGPDVPPANPGLLDVDGWEQMTVAEAAQAVERSAYPDAYGRWVDDANALVKTLTGETFECVSTVAGECPPSGLAVESGLAPDAMLVVRCAVAHFDITNIGGLSTSGHVAGSDHYTGRGVDLMIDDWHTSAGAQFGDRVAAYYVENADAFGITYLIWRDRIWSTANPTWRSYSHPDGRTDPTALHMDHLHISVSGDAASTTTKENAL
jgi:hypothetical protein